MTLSVRVEFEDAAGTVLAFDAEADIDWPKLPALDLSGRPALRIRHLDRTLLRLYLAENRAKVFAWLIPSPDEDLDARSVGADHWAWRLRIRREGSVAEWDSCTFGALYEGAPDQIEIEAWGRCSMDVDPEPGAE